MGKKYMRIYCNGTKIRSTGSSIKDICTILYEFGCYDFDEIFNTFKDANGFVNFNIKTGWAFVGKMLIPSEVALNVELTKKIKRLVLYLENQRQPHKICIYDKCHYFSFSVEIVKKHGKIKEVVDRFNLPIGVKIYFDSNLNKCFELFTNIDLLHLTHQPWRKLYHTSHKNIKITKEDN